MNDLGKCGIRADTRSLCGNKTGSIDGRSRHFIAHLFVYRDTLTGDRGFINGALSRKDHAIHRNALARTYHKDIIHLDLIDRHLFLCTIHKDRCLFWCQFHQPTQSIGRPSLGICLQHLSDRDQGQDHGCRFKIERIHILHNAVHIACHLCPGHSEKGVDTIAKRCARSHGYQGIHIGRLVPCAGKAADEELLIDDHDRHRQKQLIQAHCHMIACHKGWQRPAPHHMSHRNIHERQ